MSVQELRDEALKLSPEDREWLGHELLESVEEREISSEEGAQWKRRLEELETGKVKGVSLEETIARVDTIIKNARNKIASGS
jgi:putative addiction module component (TIGR02574 family)